MGVKPVMLPLPACPVDKHNPQARVLREGLRGSATVVLGAGISESVEALFFPVFCNVLSWSYSF